MAFRNERQTQAEITQNLMPDQTDARQRLNGSQTGETIQAYPLGEKINLDTKEGGLAFSWRRPLNSAPKTRGARMPPAFETLNGLQWGQWQGGEREMEANMIFMGVFKSTKRTLDPTDPKIGVAAYTFGATSFNIRSNTQAIHPGDELTFEVVPFHTRRGEVVQNSHASYARDALVPIINPINWGRITYYLENLFEMMFSTDPHNGVYNMGNDRLDHGPRIAGKGLNPDQRAAIALRKSTSFTVVRGLEALALRGLVKVMTPANRQREAIMMRALRANAGLLAEYQAVAETNVLTQQNVEYEPPAGARNVPRQGDVAVSESHAHFKHGLHLQAQATAEDTTIAALRKRHQLEVLYLAATTGTVETTLKKKPVQNDVLMSVFGRFSAQMHTSRVFSTSVAELATDAPNHPILRAYVNGSEDFTSEFHQLVHEGGQAIRRTIIGLALSYVPVGVKNGKCDIAVNLHSH